jgi:hypothetical protein
MKRRRRAQAAVRATFVSPGGLPAFEHLLAIPAAVELQRTQWLLLFLRRSLERLRRLPFFRPPKLLQTRVQTVPCEQLIVRAALDDAALVEHEDHIGIPDRRHPMRDHECRFAGEQAVEAFEHQALRLRVETRAGSSRIRIAESRTIARAMPSRWR